KRAYCLKIQPATGSFARNLIYSTKPPTASILIGVASMIPTITQDSFERGIVYSAGAFVAAIVAVRVGIWLYHRSDNPRDLIPGGKDDDRS
ncbi:hypothetical protein ACOICP_24300, partial [Klebsiella pneumoniae]